MAVKLRFLVGDEIWEVVRSLRRKGQAQHALYRLASDGITTGIDEAGDDERAEIVEKITMDGPVTERIEELLGLDYDAFGRSVMLAQNRFSEFLSAGPTQRDVVLKVDLAQPRSLAQLHELAHVLGVDYDSLPPEVRLRVGAAGFGRIMRLAGVEVVEVGRTV